MTNAHIYNEIYGLLCVEKCDSAYYFRINNDKTKRCATEEECVLYLETDDGLRQCTDACEDIGAQQFNEKQCVTKCDAGPQFLETNGTCVYQCQSRGYTIDEYGNRRCSSTSCNKYYIVDEAYPLMR